MIGVIVQNSAEDVVREFFELFKTPWEFYREGRRYDVVLCTGDSAIRLDAELVVSYVGRRTQFDEQHGVRTVKHRNGGRMLAYAGQRVPIYGNSIAFPDVECWLLTDTHSRHQVGYVKQLGHATVARIGYDLFEEIRTLLTTGQPAANSLIPTVEHHVSILRNLITGLGVPLMEIPPVPEGYEFIVCLTHDVDHPLIRQHKWDHTTMGFLYRAIFGSVDRFMRGRLSMEDLANNWKAAILLPFVQLGVANDFWGDFVERYTELEDGLPSTFFVIPYEGRSGTNPTGRQARLRAANYAARDIADSIRKLLATGREVGLHGIDAWLDSTSGREELHEISRLTETSEIGVRMHWLYSDQDSPMELEKAGALYDSTSGYNETIGYRAGTTQVYKPLNVNHLLEMPLHIMDTALFYPNHLNLSVEGAKKLIDVVIDNAARYGGCLTVNWHDRSTAPERLWTQSYRGLLEDLKTRGAWFATVGQAVAWFRKRRSAGFADDCGPGSLQDARQHENNTPRLQVRSHRCMQSAEVRHLSQAAS